MTLSRIPYVCAVKGINVSRPSGPGPSQFTSMLGPIKGVEPPFHSIHGYGPWPKVPYFQRVNRTPYRRVFGERHATFAACAGYPPLALIGEGSHLGAERNTLSDTPWAMLR
jgi:hypothetical protein